MQADVSDTSELDASVLVAEVVGLLNEAERYIVAPEDEQLEYLHRRAALLHRPVDVLGDEPPRSLAQDADDRARRHRPSRRWRILGAGTPGSPTGRGGRRAVSCPVSCW
jgi:hypothetical protein